MGAEARREHLSCSEKVFVRAAMSFTAENGGREGWMEGRRKSRWTAKI